MKGRIVKIAGLAVATAIGFTAMVSLGQAQTDLIKQRQDLMKSQGGAMKAINEILKADGAVADIAQHAAKLDETAKQITGLFPAGSDQGDTKALPEVWSNPDDFAAKAKILEEESAMLVTAVAGGDMAAVKAQYEKVGGACGGCHKVYKAK